MDAIRQLILSPLLGGPPYLAYFCLLVGCSIGFPFSSDLTLLTAGVLSGTGYFDLKVAIVLGLSAILLGDTFAFFIGRNFGSRIIASSFFARICSPAKFAQISGFLKQNDSKFIFMVRFTPGMRSVIFLTAGALGIKPQTFFKMNILSTSLYVPTLVTLSYFAANRADVIVREFQNMHRAILIVFGIGFAVLMLRWYRAKKKNSNATPS